MQVKFDCKKGLLFLAGAVSRINSNGTEITPLTPFSAACGRGEREATSGPPPAGWPFPSASDGLHGLGCEGNVRAFARGCSVGTCRSRFGLPGCACRVETAWPWWNKVLRSSLYLTIARSGAGDRIVRFEFAGFGDLVGAPDLAVSCTGVLCRLLCAVARSKGWRGGGWLRGGGAGARCSLASNG